MAFPIACVWTSKQSPACQRDFSTTQLLTTSNEQHSLASALCSARRFILYDGVHNQPRLKASLAPVGSLQRYILHCRCHTLAALGLALEEGCLPAVLLFAVQQTCLHEPAPADA